MKKQFLTAACGLCLAAGMAMTAGAQIYVHIGPPPPRHEVIPPPRPGYEWHAGYHRWDGHRYVWVPGNYVVIHQGHHWVPGHWDEGPRGHFWVEGHYD